MGRRNGGHDFMPDKWVFPGGRIDRADFTAPAATELRSDVLARLERTGPARRMRALALTAVRETYEETGLLLARPVPPRPSSGAWRPFLSQAVAPDLAALDFVARAVTPPYRPKRFDARFFMAEAEHLVSLERQADCGELDQIAWVDLSEARGLNLAGITRFVINEIAERLETPGRPAPSITYLKGQRRIDYL